MYWIFRNSAHIGIIAGKSRIFLVLVLLFGLGSPWIPVQFFAAPALAAVPNTVDAPPGVQRKITIITDQTSYEWWVIRWQDDQILCRLSIDHEGYPKAADVSRSCGEELALEWLDTPLCKPASRGNPNTSACSGVYIFLALTSHSQKEISIDLPPATAWLALQGCSPVPPENRCNVLPRLLITGDEPLPNEKIISVEGKLNGEAFACESDSCAIQLATTPETGVPVEFQVKSSFGDASPLYTAQVRVIDTGVSPVPGSSGWFVDVLSLQWRGARLASCSQTWQAFPPIGGPTDWLGTPDEPALLASDNAYFYLAGRLISQGVVDASSCPGGGLLPNGYADACGLERALPIVREWQNQFNSQINQIAREYGVPAQLMKNLFAQESQFWPGVFKVPYEFGLGQITDHGADAFLLWDPEFYSQFCPLVLSRAACDRGYLSLGVDDQAMLRGALAVQAKADCPNCSTGIDLTKASLSIPLFANALLANCEQVTQVINNATALLPGQVADYEDLWRFTLANYQAGPGCLSYAIHAAWALDNTRLTWNGVSEQFTPTCQRVIPYVEGIAR